MWKSPASVRMWRRSPVWTSREGLASWPLATMRPSSQARAASARVLKKRAAQSHLSIRTLLRTPVMAPLSYRRRGATTPTLAWPEWDRRVYRFLSSSANGAAEELIDGRRNLIDVCFEREMASVQEGDGCV